MNKNTALIQNLIIIENFARPSYPNNVAKSASLLSPHRLPGLFDNSGVDREIHGCEEEK
jgi:hypothetical protein